MVFIIMYVIVILLMITGLVYQAKYGKPLSILIEFVLAIVIDQVKSFICQVLTYWIVIRRLSIFPVTEGYKGKWDD